MNITKEQKEFLKIQINNIEELIDEGDTNRILDEIDTLITTKGMSKDQEWLTPLGLKLQKLYDEIYYQNE